MQKVDKTKHKKRKISQKATEKEKEEKSSQKATEKEKEEKRQKKKLLKKKKKRKDRKTSNNMNSSCDCGSQLPLVLRPETA